MLASKPENPPAQHFLGLLLHQTGRAEAGLPLIERSVQAAPGNPAFLNNYGSVLRGLGRVAASAELFARAVALSPDHPGARDNLGAAQKLLGRFEAAEKTYRGTITRHPSHMAARIGLAETLQEAAKPDEALAVFREALKLQPRHPDLLHGYGVALTEKGDLAEAAKAFRQALAIAPAMSQAWMMLAQVKKQEGRDAELAAVEAVYAKSPKGSPQRAQIAFALGKANDDLGAYDRAFDFFAEGNAIRRKAIPYDPGRARHDFAAMKAAFDEKFFRDRKPSALSDDTPVFVVGMPRSGTTLIEQIIASHPQVHGAGELNILKAAIAKAFPPDMPGGFPAGVAQAPDAAFTEAGETYLGLLRGQFPGHRHVTDKMPGNFLLVGFIHAMLPNAKIVHCAREPAATCLSIFKANFRGDGHIYGNDLAELADFHNLYADIMAHWRTVLPGVVHDVAYEDFVADQEGQTRALLAYLGLPWDEACLAFHASPRTVRTASAAQVRQPMYRGSVDLWRRYGDRLKPLLDRLA